MDAFRDEQGAFDCIPGHSAVIDSEEQEAHAAIARCRAEMGCYFRQLDLKPDVGLKYGCELANTELS